MNDDEIHLLRACAAAPADDLPRLVLADWYDEHAQPDRAAFLRLQVEAARPATDPARRDELLRTAAGLLAAHRGAWEGPLRAAGVERVGYHRGLPATLVVPPHRLLVTGGERLHELAPTAAHLHLGEGSPAVHRAVAASTHLIRLTAITFSSAGLGDAGLTALAANPAAVGLRHLAVRWDDIGDEGARAVAESPRLAGLEQLDLSANRLTAHGVRHLVQGAWLDRLTGLDLGGNPLGDAGAAVLAGSPRASRWTALNLTGCGVGLVGLRALADSRFLADQLDLRVDGFAGRFAAFREWVRNLGPGPGPGGGHRR